MARKAKAKETNKTIEQILWDSANELRGNLDAAEYKSVVLGLVFLKYINDCFKTKYDELVAEGEGFEEDPDEYIGDSIFFVPADARWEKIINAALTAEIGVVVDNAMEALERENRQLKGILPKNYARPELDKRRLGNVVDIFENNLHFTGAEARDVLGRVYEYFLGEFAREEGKKGGEFYTPECVVRTIVEVIQPYKGKIFDPACGSGGMFVQSGDFVNLLGLNANSALTFYGQEKVDYNAKLCLMNMAVHGLNAQIKSGDEANTFARDAHNLEGLCDYVMANPPFNVKKVKKATVTNSGRLPFGLPSVNDAEEISNANYLWIQYFYAYLNENGRAGFVMASSATDSQHRESEIREELVKTGDVDVMISVGNNFFYTLTLPCTLWFFDKAKPAERKDKILFIDARNYYTVVDRTLNEWNDWQIKNLNAIVWLYRGETDRYKALIRQYNSWLGNFVETHDNEWLHPDPATPASIRDGIDCSLGQFKKHLKELEAKHKAATKRADKAEIKAIIDETSSIIAEFTEALEVANQLVWLTDKFGEDGTYNDVAGLCKIATLVDVEAKKFSLTPGAYVGVAEQEHDGVDFSKRMAEIHQELSELQKESAALFAEIQANQSELWK